MSEAKDKAKELVKKLTLSSNAQDGSWMCKDLAKQCALIAVEEILNLVQCVNSNEIELDFNYWQEIKKELEKL